ncbi:hypothetical protein [Alkalihalobacterium bogoriense]|uniref:hypothetical protein n=1 Tax=Alkalihalobacterium bogoriense TaxID=246272 RepID=UPI00047A6157|nr:hypothetical protein [Alkalihalobacterium bogoriense]
MRDVSFIPIDGKEELVIATDCAGAIGEKPEDEVKVPLEVVSYYTARVAMMECVSVGATPFAVVLQNFAGDDSWEKIKGGIQQACSELGLQNIKITGSSESNFHFKQTAIGISVLGKVDSEEKRIAITPPTARFAVIGKPLVGNEVIEQANDVLSLSLFHSLLDFTYEMIPIGSKGIAYELNELMKDNELQATNIKSTLALTKSAGPATCALISYHEKMEPKIKELVGHLFFRINLV